ncbi:MAG: fibronectin type III domain-containing protein [Acutalibacteraceae bacterium]
MSGLKATYTDTTVTLSWNKVSGATGYIVYRYDATTQKYVDVGRTAYNTFLANGLAKGMTQKFAVRAYKTVGGQTYSSNYVYLTTSTVPATVSYTLTSTTNSVKVNWTKVAGATGYLVYYRTNTGESWTKLADSTGTTYTKTGLTPGKSYIFTVKAYRKVDGVIYNAAHSPKTVSTLPATVSYTLTSTANSVKVTWTKVTGATGYLVYYRTNTSESWTKLADSTGTTYTKTGLTPGKSYIFTVKAYRKVDGVTYNAAHSPKTVSTCPATVNYTLTTSGGSVKVAWTKVAGATGYLVYYRTNTSESWTKLTDSTGTSFTKTGLTKGKSYIFTVKAYRKVDGVTYNAAHSPKTITVK